MIIIDPRDGNPKDLQASLEFQRHLRAMGCLADLSRLDAGDFAFEGYTDKGIELIGIERKTLHDLLNCIDDGHYNAQRIKMKNMYRCSILIVEGIYKRHEDGWLMEGYKNKRGEIEYTHCKYRSRPVLYSKLRYLFSVILSGVIVTTTQTLYQTAYMVQEWYQYFQEHWDNHTSLLSVQKMLIPAIDNDPPLVRKWACDIEGVGIKRSMEAQRLFKTPIKLANSDELDWLQIEGIGVPTAQSIIRQIGGRKKER